MGGCVCGAGRGGVLAVIVRVWFLVFYSTAVVRFLCICALVRRRVSFVVRFVPGFKFSCRCRDSRAPFWSRFSGGGDFGTKAATYMQPPVEILCQF